MPDGDTTFMGSLEALEASVHDKIATISGLLKLRSAVPTESNAQLFDDVINTFREISDHVRELQKLVDEEKAILKYIKQVLASNEEQHGKIERLLNILKDVKTLKLAPKPVLNDPVSSLLATPEEHEEARATHLAPRPRHALGHKFRPSQSFSGKKVAHTSRFNVNLKNNL